MGRIWGICFLQKSLRRKSQALFFCRQVTHFAKNKNTTVVEAASPPCTVAYIRTKVAYTHKVSQTRPVVSHHCEGQWSRSCSTHLGDFSRISLIRCKAKRKASSACRQASSTRAKCSYMW